MRKKTKARKEERRKERIKRLITRRKAERESAKLARAVRPKGKTIRKANMMIELGEQK